jgi:hypothetical protein
MHADGHTDMTKLIVAFLDCANSFFKQRISKFSVFKVPHIFVPVFVFLSRTLSDSFGKWRVDDFPCAHTGGVQKPIHPQNLDLIPTNDMISLSDTRYKLN